MTDNMLMNLLGWRWYRRISPFVQLVLIAALLVMFLSMSSVAHEIDPASPASHAARIYPPAWFVGAYQRGLGWTQPVFTDLAARGRLALMLFGFAAAGAFALGYKRHARRSLEVAEISPAGPGWLSTVVTDLTHRILLRTPSERAAFHFVWQTTMCSGRHRGLLAAWVAAGCALVFHSIAGVMGAGQGLAWQSRHGPLLAVPLVLSFFALCGLRYVFTLPAELPANWLFRVSANPDISKYLGGIRKAAILLGIVPLFGLLLPLYVAVWGWTAGGVHVLSGAVIAVLLLDVLLTGFAKVPFTCSYVPGKANMKSLWGLYVFAFLTYLSAFSGLQLLILEEPSRIVWLLTFAAICETGLYVHRRRSPPEDNALVFDERPAPAVQTLDLQA